MDEGRIQVAVAPDTVHWTHGELLRALEEAFPVTFTSDTQGAAATILFPGSDVLNPPPCPHLVLRGRRGAHPAAPFRIALTTSPVLSRPLRGQILTENGQGVPEALDPEPHARVLASVSGRPVWTHSTTRGTERFVAAAEPGDLADDEFLRSHLSGDRFWDLLPVIEFLRTVTGARSPLLRACFVIDDPNPRFSSYGHVRFADLVHDAREAGYHVSCACIPLDLLTSGSAGAEAFRTHPGQLSLSLHGNDHTRHELERPRSAADTDRLVRSALARTAGFERRAGVRVDRVMCPPHGRCSLETLSALSAAGFDGLAASRPFPWDDFSGHRRWRLGGWLPAQLTTGGLPVIPRHHIGGGTDDLAFRALLGQPLIVYCHHGDLADGLERFRAVAGFVATLGPVKWMSLARIARSNATVEAPGDRTVITPYSRDLHLRFRPTTTVELAIPRVMGATSMDVRVSESPPVALPTGATTTVNLSREQTELRVRMISDSGPPDAQFGDWRPRAWPALRRTMTETRDRLAPVAQRVTR